MIGNSDAHGKNISFFVGKAGIDVAPSYDLLNIDIYGDDFERDLAMAIGDEFVADEILPYQLAEFCDECKLPQRQVATSLKNLCTVVLNNLDGLPMDDIQDGPEMDFARELLWRIRDNAVRFREFSQELGHLKF